MALPLLKIARVSLIGGWATALIVGQGLAATAPAAEAGCHCSSETPWPTKDWEVSTPEEQGLDSAALAQLVDLVGIYKQDSLLIVRHGKIVTDAYYAPYAPNIRHDLRSVTKSFIGTLTGIEVREGLLDSVDHPIVDLFPDKRISNLDAAKKAITVQNMLDMTSGIAWEEQAYTPDEPIIRMYKSPDPTEFVLSQPMSAPPGARFYYDGGNPYVLSALITRKAGRDALDFARDELFKPLGISDVRWGETDAQGVTDGESGLYLTPRNMAKLGYLYLHDGSWDGQQIIPPSWVDRVRQGPVTATDGYHYANLWWSLPDRDVFMARGRHSQLILVLPKLDVVVVMTGALEEGASLPLTYLIDGVAGAVKSDAALPTDPGAQALLAASIRKAASERAAPVGPTPDLAKAISGKTYHLADNALHVETLSLNLVDPNPSWELTAATERLNRPTVRFGGAIGLDGLFRKSSARYGIDAVKGSWLDDHTFVVERRILGHGETQKWTLAFDGDKVEIKFASTDGGEAELRGEAVE